MKGIILAGGSGKHRLYPIRKAYLKDHTCYQTHDLLPAFLFFAAGIRDILIISTPRVFNLYEDLIMDGHQWGLRVAIHSAFPPDGLAQALLSVKNFMRNDSVCLVRN